MMFRPTPSNPVVSEEYFIGMLDNLRIIASKWDREPYVVFVFVDDVTKITGWRTTRPFQFFPERFAIRQIDNEYFLVYRPGTGGAIAEGNLVGMFLTTKDFPQQSISL